MYGAGLVAFGRQVEDARAERDHRLEPPSAPEAQQPFGEHAGLGHVRVAAREIDLRLRPQPGERHARTEARVEGALHPRDREDLGEQRGAARHALDRAHPPAPASTAQVQSGSASTSGSVTKRVTTGSVGSGTSTTSGAGREVIASSRKLARSSSTARIDSTSAMRAVDFGSA